MLGKVQFEFGRAKAEVLLEQRDALGYSTSSVQICVSLLQEFLFMHPKDSPFQKLAF